MSTNWNQVESIFKHTVVGDSFRIECELHNGKQDRPPVEAWLTVKASPEDADPGIFQKHITTTEASGQGVITVGSCVSVLSFDVMSTDTELLNPDIQYCYDIQVLIGTATLVTLEAGTFRPLHQVTLAS